MLIYVSRGAEPRNKLYYCDLHLLPEGKIQGEYHCLFQLVRYLLLKCMPSWWSVEVLKHRYLLEVSFDNNFPYPTFRCMLP